MSGPARSPVLGVCLAADDALAAVLAELVRWLPVTACGDDGQAYEGPPPEVFLASGPIGGAPWVQHAAAGDPIAPDALAVLTSDPGVLAAAGARGVAFPTRLGAGYLETQVRWTPPFVRRRMRQALGPAGDGALIADRRGPRWLDDEAGLLPRHRLDAALSRCAAVWAVDSQVAARALAWGAPLVVPEELALELDLIAEVNVRVSDLDGMRRTLAELAGDHEASARLSWAGRRHYEDRYDAARCAALLADAVGAVVPLQHDGLLGAKLELALLGTPADGRPPARLLRASAGLISDRAPVIGPDDGGPPVSLTPAATDPVDPDEPAAPAPAASAPGRLSRLSGGRVDRWGAAARSLARGGVQRVEDRVYRRVQGQLLSDAARLDDTEPVLRRIEAELVTLRTTLPRRLDALERRLDALEGRPPGPE